MGIGSFLKKGLKKIFKAPNPRPNSPFDSSTPTSSSSLGSPNSASKIQSFSRSRSERCQLEELQRVFHKFDSNNDGKISRSELGSIIASLGHQVSKEELDSMIAVADSDGDGYIDMNEFIELNINGVDAPAVLEDLRHAFLIFDADGNGSISPEELQNVLKSLGDDTSVAECEKMIRGVDRNGDGTVDFNEFKIMMSQSLPWKMRTAIEK